MPKRLVLSSFSVRGGDPMPTARIIHHWPGKDAGHTVLEVQVQPAHPDATDVARSNVTRMWRDVCDDEAEADVEVDEP